MKTVVIPITDGRIWHCEINGIEFEYPAGTSVSVPDAVAAVIDNIYAQIPMPAPEPENGMVWTWKDGQANWETVETGSQLPAWSNNKWLKSSSSGCSWASLPLASVDAAGLVKCGGGVFSLDSDEDDISVVVDAYNILVASLVEAGVVEDYGTYVKDDGGMNGDDTGGGMIGD